MRFSTVKIAVIIVCILIFTSCIQLPDPEAGRKWRDDQARFYKETQIAVSETQIAIETMEKEKAAAKEKVAAAIDSKNRDTLLTTLQEVPFTIRADFKQEVLQFVYEDISKDKPGKLQRKAGEKTIYNVIPEVTRKRFITYQSILGLFSYGLSDNGSVLTKYVNDYLALDKYKDKVPIWNFCHAGLYDEISSILDFDIDDITAYSSARWRLMNAAQDILDANGSCKNRFVIETCEAWYIINDIYLSIYDGMTLAIEGYESGNAYSMTMGKLNTGEAIINWLGLLLDIDCYDDAQSSYEIPKFPNLTFEETNNSSDNLKTPAETEEPIS